MREVDVVGVLEEALQMIAAEFHVSVSVMAASLRQAAVGTSCTFLLHGAEQSAEPRYHGTSWKGLIGISTRGFLPCWGAGRAKALEKFKVDLPVVYTSPDWDLALWYPMAMVDIRGDRIGERVASDASPMRIVLICKADATKRRIKIRRGKNKQDAWLPKDLEICGVAFHLMSAAANESAAQDEDGAESDVDANPPRAGVWAENEDSEDQEDFEAEPENEDTKDQEMVLSTLVAWHLMVMRIHKDDLRSNGDLAYDVLQFAHLRKNVRKHSLCWWTPLSPEQMSTIWTHDLMELFCEQTGETGRPWKQQKIARRHLHSIFRVWLRQRFGHVRGVRDILQQSCGWRIYEELEYRQNVMIVDVCVVTSAVLYSLYNSSTH